MPRNPDLARFTDRELRAELGTRIEPLRKVRRGSKPGCTCGAKGCRKCYMRKWRKQKLAKEQQTESRLGAA